MIKHYVSLDNEKFQAKPDKNITGIIVNRIGSVETNTEVTIEELIEKLVQPNGQSWSPGLYNGIKSKDKWMSQGFIALDFDYEDPDDPDPDVAKKAQEIIKSKKVMFGENYKSNLTYEQVIERCEKYNVMPCVVHTSFSANRQNHKFRVIFQLYETVTNFQIIDSILYLFFILFPESDQSCATDRSRFFFGGKDILWSEYDNILNPYDLFKSAIEHIKENYNENYDIIKEQLLFNTNLRAIKRGAYEDYKNLSNDEKTQFYIQSSDKGSSYYQFVFGDLKSTANFVKPVIKTTMSEFDIKWVSDALNFIDPNGYETWYKVGMGLKQEFGESAKDLWIEWSKKANEPDSTASIEKKWDRAIKPNGSLTIGTLAHLAYQGGWNPIPKTVKTLNKDHFHYIDDCGNEVIFQEVTLSNKNQFDREIKNTFLKPKKRGPFVNFEAGIETLKFKKIVKGIEEEVFENRATFWLKHEKRRRMQRIVFEPNLEQVKPGDYNLWTGFAVGEVSVVDESRFSLYKKHLFEIIANGDKNIAKYIIGWMAFCVQHPNKLSEVAIILFGKAGTGKSLWVELFAQIFGKHYICAQEKETLTGRFNDHLADKVLVFVDEAFWHKDFAAIDKLKNYLTNPNMNVDGKFKSIVTVKNYMHLIMASNKSQILTLDTDDRRFFIVEVNEKWGKSANNTEIQKVAMKKYFDDMIEQFIDKDGISHFFTYLKNLDISNFNVRNFPETDIRNEHKLRSLDGTIAGFLKTVLDSEKLYPLADEWGVVGKDYFYDDYCKYVRVQSPTYTKPDGREIFGRTIRKILGSDMLINSTAIINILDPATKTKTRVKEHVFRFQPRHLCRHRFCEYTGIKIEWTKFEDKSDNVDFLSDFTKNVI